MSLTFNDLTEDEQLKHANDLEIWARGIREAHRWRRARRQELADAGPPPGDAERETLDRHIEHSFARRVSSPPPIESVRGDDQST